MTVAPGALDEDLLPVADVLFGGRREVAEAYASALATTAVERGLIGPREVDRIWERHVLNSAVIGEVIDRGVAVADVGSGAGLPGIPLALARPDLHVTLVEPLLRRVRWLEETLGELGLPNVGVERARAEESGLRGQVDVVVCRAVAPLTRLVPLVTPLLREPGTIVALKGRSATEELVEAETELTASGVTESQIHLCGEELVAEPTTVVRLVVPRRPAARRARRR